MHSLENAVWERPSTVYRLMDAKHLWNPHEGILIIFFLWLWAESEICGVFGNTLTADDKYPVRDCENLQFPNQMQSS